MHARAYQQIVEILAQLHFVYSQDNVRILNHFTIQLEKRNKNFDREKFVEAYRAARNHIHTPRRPGESI